MGCLATRLCARALIARLCPAEDRRHTRSTKAIFRASRTAWSLTNHTCSTPSPPPLASCRRFSSTRRARCGSSPVCTAGSAPRRRNPPAPRASCTLRSAPLRLCASAYCALRPASCGMRHASCGMRHAPYALRPAPVMRPASCATAHRLPQSVSRSDVLQARPSRRAWAS